MSTALQNIEHHEIARSADNDDQEDSGVFVSRSRMALDVAIGELRASTVGEPSPIYATPYVRSGRQRARYTRDYCLGVRFATGVIAAEGWDDEMTGDGVPEFVIERCREYLAGHAM